MVASSNPTSSLTSSPASVAILFDIDGTLIDSAGAGGGALLEALRREFDLLEVQPVVLHGRTDLGIMTELLRRNCVEPQPANVRRLYEHYFRLLPEELSKRQGRILPGVPRILTALQQCGGCHLGLLTGNMPHSAQAKLEHFGLWNYFDFGIFGDQAVERHELSVPATRAVHHRSRCELPPRQIIIIGDTPLDVELARVMGARCLAVCTGGFDESSLIQAGAEQVVHDLSHTEGILQWIFEPQQATL